MEAAAAHTRGVAASAPDDLPLQSGEPRPAANDGVVLPEHPSGGRMAGGALRTPTCTAQARTGAVGPPGRHPSIPSVVSTTQWRACATLLALLLGPRLHYLLPPLHTLALPGRKAGRAAGPRHRRRRRHRSQTRAPSLPEAPMSQPGRARSAPPHHVPADYERPRAIASNRPGVSRKPADAGAPLVCGLVLIVAGLRTATADELGAAGWLASPRTQAPHSPLGLYYLPTSGRAGRPPGRSGQEAIAPGSAQWGSGARLAGGYTSGR